MPTTSNFKISSHLSLEKREKFWRKGTHTIFYLKHCYYHSVHPYSFTLSMTNVSTDNRAPLTHRKQHRIGREDKQKSIVLKNVKCLLRQTVVVKNNNLNLEHTAPEFLLCTIKWKFSFYRKKFVTNPFSHNISLCYS